MINMDIGKYLIFSGFILVFIGLIFMLSDKIPIFNFFGKLFGDFSYKSENVSIFVPFTSMILLSIILSLLINLFNKFFK